MGYALDGKQCIYNIDIMEETVSVLALGAGAVSKGCLTVRAELSAAPIAKAYMIIYSV